MTIASTQTHHRVCHLCEAMCGLVIKTEADKVIDIRGDKDDPLSRGHVCPKAVALQDIHEDPDRLRKPLKRIKSEAGVYEHVEIVLSCSRSFSALEYDQYKPIVVFSWPILGLYVEPYRFLE